MRNGMCKDFLTFPQKQVIKPSCERCSPLPREKEDPYLQILRDTENNLNEQVNLPLV